MMGGSRARGRLVAKEFGLGDRGGGRPPVCNKMGGAEGRMVRLVAVARWLDHRGWRQWRGVEGALGGGVRRGKGSVPSMRGMKGI